MLSISLMAAFLGSASSSPAAGTARPVHTYSIVARDPATGEMGVAVQSHWFSVGAVVSWAEAGVGAVATQSFVDPAYGPLGLSLMRGGKTAPQALESLLVSDSGREVRQVAMIDTQGNVAAHTGKRCIQGAGHKVGKDFSVQANLMLNDTIWGAMANAYQAAQGDLADRMLAALEALVPDNLEMKFWHAIALVNAKRVDQALPMFKGIFAKDCNWATLVPRLPASGALVDDPKVVERILSVAPKR